MIDIEWLFIHFSHCKGIVNGEKSFLLFNYETKVSSWRPAD
jgi:hypothetical protein